TTSPGASPLARDATAGPPRTTQSKLADHLSGLCSECSALECAAEPASLCASPVEPAAWTSLPCLFAAPTATSRAPAEPFGSASPDSSCPGCEKNPLSHV